MGKKNPSEADRNFQPINSGADKGLSIEQATALQKRMKDAGKVPRGSFPAFGIAVGKGSESQTASDQKIYKTAREIQEIILENHDIVTNIQTIEKFLDGLARNQLEIASKENVEQLSNFVSSEEDLTNSIKLSLSSNFGISAEIIDDKHALIAELASHFLAASGNSSQETVIDRQALSQPLTIPQGIVERYQGKKKSGEIYSFLQRVYRHEPNGQPLTLSYLKEHDPAALSSFRGRRVIAEIPDDLLVLTDQDWGKKQATLVQKHGVDLSTPEGIAEGKRLMGALSNLIYPTRKL